MIAGVDSIRGPVARNWRSWVALAVGLAISGAVGYWMVHPLRASPIGYDTAGSVLYFQRMVHGQVLEQPYGATPKPLMTLLDGLLYTLGGWNAISVAAVVVCAVAITLTAALVRRTAGSVAAVFVFVALLGSQPLVQDEVRAYVVAWAWLWLLLAAFALNARRPRYFVAGLALCAATLTRLEVIVVAAGAVGCVALWQWLIPVAERRWPGRLGIGPAPRRAWLLSLGLLALPVMMIHDWILIRDPLYWAHVSADYSVHYASTVKSPVGLTVWLIGHYGLMALLVVLAVVGVFFLVKRRQYAIGVGLLLLGPGIGMLLLLIAARHTYVSGRYVYLMDLALTVTAAFGIALVRVPELAVAFRSRRTLRKVAALAAAAAIGAAAATPFALVDAGTRRDVFTQRSVSRNLVAADARIRAAVKADSGTTTSPVLLAPGLWTPRLIVDLGLRIADVGAPLFNATGTDYRSQLHVGELLYHDHAGDPANEVAAALESGTSLVLGGHRLEVVASDAAAGWWLYRVTAPG